MRKLFLRAFSSFFLLLVTGSALASTSYVQNLNSGAVDNHTDLSVAYLAQVFGTVGNVLHGTSGQMLGHLFYIFNQGILIVAGLWLGYTTITMVLKSAQEGSFMGANKNVATLLLKIALGFGLLLPNPATGYSIFQDVVMKVVVEGVSLADLTWSNGLKYLNDGGTLWRNPDSQKVNASNLSSGFTQPIQQVFQNEVCMYASNAYNQEQANNNNSGGGDYNSQTQTRQYHVVETKDGFQFPGVGNTATLNGETGNCGSIAWNSIPGSTKDGKATAQAQYAKNATSRIVYDVLPAAKEYFCGSGSDLATNASFCTNSSADYKNDVPEAFFGSLVDYMNAIYPLAQHQSGEASHKAKDFLQCSEHSDCAQNQGWIMAGRYYWDLSQIQSHLKQVKNLSHYAVTAHTRNPTQVKSAVDNAKSDAKGYMQTAKQKLEAYQKASGDYAGSGHIKSYSYNASDSLVNVFMHPVFNDFKKLTSEFGSKTAVSDPIVFLHQLGMDSISVAGYIWLGLAVTIIGMTALLTVCNATLNLNFVFKNFQDWIRPFFMLMASALLGVGVVLGYYVPLYPFMLFTFGVIGWLIAVIEAMVAAPLVCLGLTHPEGHDFLGQAQQALMLLLGVFLRPVLMVIGLFAGMILSYVSFRIVIYTFSGFVSDLFYTSAPTVGGSSNLLTAIGMAQTNIASTGWDAIMSLMVAPILLVIFTSIVYVVTNQCFSLIYALPDNILRWIGAPTSQSMSAQMADQVKGAVSSFGNSAAQGMDKGLNSQMHKNPMAEQKKQDAKTQFKRKAKEKS